MVDYGQEHAALLHQTEGAKAAWADRGYEEADGLVCHSGGKGVLPYSAQLRRLRCVSDRYTGSSHNTDVRGPDSFVCLSKIKSHFLSH